MTVLTLRCIIKYINYYLVCWLTWVCYMCALFEILVEYLKKNHKFFSFAFKSSSVYHMAIINSPGYHMVIISSPLGHHHFTVKSTSGHHLAAIINSLRRDHHSPPGHHRVTTGHHTVIATSPCLPVVFGHSHHDGGGPVELDGHSAVKRHRHEFASLVLDVYSGDTRERQVHQPTVDLE